MQSDKRNLPRDQIVKGQRPRGPHRGRSSGLPSARSTDSPPAGVVCRGPRRGRASAMPSQDRLKKRAMRMPALVAACLMFASPSAAQGWAAIDAILKARCVSCHAGAHAPLGLRLDTYAGLMMGSDNGPVVNIESPSQSALIRRLRGEAEPRMPLDGPPWLAATGILAVESWISAGAPGPEAAAAETADSKPPPAADPLADGRIVYGEVASIFRRRCIECHSDNSRRPGPPEGLRLTSRKRILAGGDRIVVIPGNAQASELIRRIEGLSQPRMPHDGPPWLSQEQILLLREWVAGGALDDAFAPAPVPIGRTVRIRGVMTGPHEIDGVPFAVVDGTRIEDAPRLGEEAEMRGMIARNGAISAQRVKRR